MGTGLLAFNSTGVFPCKDHRQFLPLPHSGAANTPTPAGINVESALQHLYFDTSEFPRDPTSLLHFIATARYV
uniref:Uncharacterized protein n=1 Tax=Romanomermis culicivorax TaxID=13658 RepID=A0A915L885_ROMCU